MGQYEYDLYISKKKVATFYDDETLKSFLWRMVYYSEIRIVPYTINDLGERVEVNE